MFLRYKLATQQKILNSTNIRQLVLCALLFIALGFLLLRSYWLLRHYDEHDVDVRGLVLTGRRIFKSRAQAVVSDEEEENDPTFFCDRSHERTDICVMKGDVRVDAGANAVVQVLPVEDGRSGAIRAEREERVRPYTRKWEASVMQGIDEVRMRRRWRVATKSGKGNRTEGVPACHVAHDVPAVVFSTGGYTGNVYHEFNDGLIPLFMTAQRFQGEVVLMVLEYHDWWMSKYGEIVRQLSHHEVLDFSSKDGRVHCFPEVIVGLAIHDELAIDPAKLEGVSMADFQRVLHDAYTPRLQSRAAPPLAVPHRPKLVLVSRESPRALLNQDAVVALAEEMGFQVEVLSPRPTTEMVDIYGALQSCDVMMGVHGAAMTHLLFVRPGCTFIQVVPLGTDWAALTYYGEPARKLGLNYVEYKVTPQESSLWGRYSPDDPVLSDPDSVNLRGWSETKRIYLDAQDLRLSLPRLRRTLLSAYSRHIDQQMSKNVL